MTDEATQLTTWGQSIEHASLAVLGLHGRGQDVGFIRSLTDRIGMPEIAYFAPTAPEKSWYPRPFLEESNDNLKALEEALATVEMSVRYIRQLGFKRVVLLGFSQGSCVLAHFLLTRLPKVEGAVLYTGGYVGGTSLDESGLARRDNVPVLIRSIDRDPWVPAHRVADTARLLCLGGSHVDVMIEAGSDHIITDRGIDDGRAFLAKLVDDSVAEYSERL